MLREAIPLGLVSLFALGLAPACTATARIDDVYTALDGDGVRKRTIFYTDSKEIHCIAEVGISRDGVTMETVIRQVQNGRGQGVNRVIATAEGVLSKTNGLGKFDLEIIKADQDGKPLENGDDAPFLPGQFVCEFRLDGGDPVVTPPFNVYLAPCPTTFVIPKGVCAPFYGGGTKCERDGANTGSPLCQCSEPDGWLCP